MLGNLKVISGVFLNKHCRSVPMMHCVDQVKGGGDNEVELGGETDNKTTGNEEDKRLVFWILRRPAGWPCLLAAILALWPGLACNARLACQQPKPWNIPRKKILQLLRIGACSNSTINLGYV